MTRYRAAFLDPEGARYGIPTYPWRSAPPAAEYATRRQLRAAGLSPGGHEPAAQVMWRGVGGNRVAYLYDVKLAVTKRIPTPLQLEAVEKALAARRTCPECGQLKGYYIPRKLGECLDCAEPQAVAS